MKIAHLLVASASFPLKKHNGRYEWALRLARLQAKQGHDVVVFCGPDSHDTTPNLHFRSLPLISGNHEQDNRALVETAFAMPGADVYHSHFDSLHYTLAHLTVRPIVFTQHWFPDQSLADVARATKYPKNVVAVPVTQYMQTIDEQLHIPSDDVIYHGIDLALFHPSLKPKTDHFLYVGRIAPHKGVKEAVEIAQRAKIKLDIIGKINNADLNYWREIEPLVDGRDIRYLGSKTQPELVTYYQQARALLFPNQQLEAFGQTTIEAQACGTPVITSQLGANHELLNEGITGFSAKTLNDYLFAIAKVGNLDPRSCRHFAEQFDVVTMANRYMALYTRLAHY